MNLNHLAIFHAVAETRGISLGAERLHISQPAVSKQIQELERSLGTKLFDRVPRGVRLTESGEVLAGYARRLFVLESEAETALAELRGLERGKLSIGASLTIGGYLLPDVLQRFHETYPGIQISVDIANTEDVQKRLHEGELDIGLTEGFLDHPELEASVFHEDEMVVIVPPGHSLLEEKDITPERLCREPFLMREAGSGTRAVVERAFYHRGLRIEPVMSFGSIEAIKGGVAAGIGIAMVSALTIRLEEETGRLIRLNIKDFVVLRPLHVLQLGKRHQSRAALAFRNELIASGSLGSLKTKIQPA